MHKISAERAELIRKTQERFSIVLVATFTFVRI